MSLWIEETYLKLIGHRLTRFSQIDTHRWKCSCPICGDSAKKKNKTRCYFGVKTGKLMLHCFNCNAGKQFSTFLREFDNNLYQQFILETFKDNLNTDSRNLENIMKHIPETKKYIPDIFADLPLVSSMDSKSLVYIFSEQRKLPIDTFEFHFAVNFVDWAKGHTEKFNSWRGKDHSRLIIPWRDREAKIIGYSARALDNSQEQKYYRIFLDDSSKEKYFGIDRFDASEQVYVLEGEIDSLMIPNAIAVGNGKLHSYMNKDAIYIPDSDTRNPHIMRGVREMIDVGLRVCLLPTDLPKDLNEMAQNGFTCDEIIDIINGNTVQGLAAKMKFSTWKGC